MKDCRTLLLPSRRLFHIFRERFFLFLWLLLLGFGSRGRSFLLCLLGGKLFGLLGFCAFFGYYKRNRVVRIRFDMFKSGREIVRS